MKKINKVIFMLSIILMTVMVSACGTSLPESSDDSTYKNEDIGFKLSYPEGYVILDQTQINDLLEKNIEKIKSLYTDSDQAEQAIRDNIPVVMAFKHEVGYSGGFNSNFNLIVREVPYFPTMNIVDFTNQVVEEANKQSSTVTFNNATAVKIDGHDAALCKTEWNSNGYDMIQEQFYIANNNHLAVITISAADDSELNELLKIIDSIKFVK